MNHKIIKGIGSTSGYLELGIGILILIGIGIMSIQLVGDIVDIISGVTHNSVSTQFETFLYDSLNLVIGIEFVKMLIKHTPESVIEVLVFAIARKLIVGHASNIELFIDIIAITLLFVIRKYLYCRSWSADKEN